MNETCYSERCLPCIFRVSFWKCQCVSLSTHEHKLTCYTRSFTPIIICRFTLDLRQVKSPDSSWLSGSQSASLRFVGNAGGSLRFGPDEDEEGEEDVEQFAQAEISGVSIADYKDESGIANGVGAAGCVSIPFDTRIDQLRPLLGAMSFILKY